MNDLISRQAAIDAINRYGSVWMEYTEIMSVDELAERALKASKQSMVKILHDLPSAQPESFEWCTDCKEYDQEAHCCHRWSKTIQKTVEEMQIVRCKDCRYYNSEEKECLDLLGHGRRWEEDDFCSYGERNEVTE